MRFMEFRAGVVEHWQAGRYPEALDLIAQHMASFPTQLARTSSWKAMLYGALGQPEQALAAMQQMVAGGAWLSERALGFLAGLKGIEELPGYAEMLQACRDGHAAALAASQPELLTQCADSSPRPAPLVLALHGNMACAAAAAAEWAPAVAQGCFVGLAQSSQIEGPDVYVWDDWAKGEREVAQHYQRLVADPAVAADRTLLGGFSMGGGLAAWLALKGSVPVRGFVVMGPYIPDMEQIKAALPSARERGVRGYILCGDQDGECLPHAQTLHDLMRSYDLPVELEIIPGLPHAFPADFGDRFARARAAIFG